jgi:translation initiation factor 2 subunit 1
MYYKKKGMPQERDVVIVTVKKILYHSIFAVLDEYEGKEGMIHISEIAPGRIRNIRDYVKEGKKLVCLILKIDPVKGHIDLSLRRVPMSLRNKKNEEFKQEIKSEKLLEYMGKELKTDIAGMYKKIGFPLIEEFGLLQVAFNEIAIYGPEAIEDIKLPAKEKEFLIKTVQEKIKPPEVSIQCDVILENTNPDGVENIKKTLLAGKKASEKMVEEKITLTYVSAPRYKLEIFARDYKAAEESLTIITDAITKEAKKTKTSIEIERKK